MAFSINTTWTPLAAAADEVPTKPLTLKPSFFSLTSDQVKETMRVNKRRIIRRASFRWGILTSHGNSIRYRPQPALNRIQGIGRPPPFAEARGLRWFAGGILALHKFTNKLGARPSCCGSRGVVPSLWTQANEGIGRWNPAKGVCGRAAGNQNGIRFYPQGIIPNEVEVEQNGFITAWRLSPRDGRGLRGPKHQAINVAASRVGQVK